MLNSIFHAGTFSIEAVLTAMAAALILGLAIAIIYKQSGIHIGSFAVVLAVLPLLVSVVILIVNGNLGASVAVLGAFGLIRFRSAPEQPEKSGLSFLQWQ